MKKKRIRWIVLIIFLVACSSLLLWQWNNVQAITYMLTLDNTQLAERNKKNDEQFNELMQKYNLEFFTEEELRALLNGSPDIESAENSLVEGTEINRTASQKNQRLDATVDYTEEIRLQIAQMYVLKSTFVGKLEAIVAQAKSEFEALSPEARTNDAKVKIVKSKTNQIAALEKECDGEVSAVVSQLQVLLKESGEDQSLVDKVKTVYAEEKSLKKAYYMNELNN